MKITNDIPKNWRDLQDKVCKLLNESGYPSVSPKTICTVRGKIEVDVFSESNGELGKQFICECKYWNRAIPKAHIHSFRSVVQDSGSMLGIFISKAGYQAGAYEAANCSNILLKDWEGFLKLIEKDWLKCRILKIKKIAHPLSIYTDPWDVPLNKLSEKEREEYIELNEKSMDVYLACRFINNGVLLEESIKVSNCVFTALDELFDYFESVCSDRIKEYEKIFASNPIESWKFESWQHMLM